MCRQFDSSQHHGNPLKISGFFVSVPLSVPLFEENLVPPHYTVIACTVLRKAVFGYTLRYQMRKRVVFTYPTDNELQTGTETGKLGRKIASVADYS